MSTRKRNKCPKCGLYNKRYDEAFCFTCTHIMNFIDITCQALQEHTKRHIFIAINNIRITKLK